MGSPTFSNFKNVVLVVIVVWIPLLELLSYMGLRVLSERGIIYDPPEVTEESLDHYIHSRDPVLGWPSPTGRTEPPYDGIGARQSPAFPSPTTPACVATFGDSFTFGDQVGPEDAYPNRLAERLGCRVNNYGVGGYGSDQALIRFRAVEDPAPIVVFAHYSDNIIRNVNRFRNLIAPSTGLGFKPRFVMSDRLELVPIPTPPSVDSIADISGAWMSDEYFLPGGEAGIIELGFPYTVKVLRAFSNYRVRARFAGVPSYAPFYAADHPSNALAVTIAILIAVLDETAAHGQTPILVALPGHRDVEAALAGNPQPYYQPLLDALGQHGVATPNVIAAMLDFLDVEKSVCDLFVNCNEHYTPAGNDLVAQVIYDWIEDRGLVEQKRAP